MKGKVKIFKNDKLLFEKSNTITTDYKNHVINGITDSTLVELMTDANFFDIQSNSSTTLADKDGILASIIFDDPNLVNGKQSAITTRLSPTEAHGARFRGLWKNTSSDNATVTNFDLGANINSGGLPMTFANNIASFDPDDITLESLDKVILEWEIFIP